jgi:hypothetical protein
MFGAETVNAPPDILILCAACLPRLRLQQISDLSAHNCVVRIAGCVVRIEGCVVKKVLNSGGIFQNGGEK